MLTISIHFSVNIRAEIHHDSILEKAYKKQGGWGRRGNLGFPTKHGFPYPTPLYNTLVISFFSHNRDARSH